MLLEIWVKFGLNAVGSVSCDDVDCYDDDVDY